MDKRRKKTHVYAPRRLVEDLRELDLTEEEEEEFGVSVKGWVRRRGRDGDRSEGVSLKRKMVDRNESQGSPANERIRRVEERGERDQATTRVWKTPPPQRPWLQYF